MNDLFLAFAHSLTALTLCIVVGYICRRKQMLNDIHTKGMADLLVKVTMPCTVFMSLMRPFSRALLAESMATFFITGIIYILGSYLGLWLAKLMKATPGERQGWQFGTGFGNVAFMGIPVVMAVFGDEGLIYVSMASISFNLLAFTFGSRIFDNAPKTIHLKSLFLNTPSMPAIAVGFILFLTGFRLPNPLEGGISLIGGMTAPISMILIGTILAKQSLRESFTDFRILPAAVAKLIFIPLLSLVGLSFVIPNPLMLSVIVTLMAMPPAAITVIFAEQYDADAPASAKFVVVCTVLSVITVPIISLLM